MNRKTTFSELITETSGGTQPYLPIRILALEKNEIEKPYFKILNPNTIDNIQEGIKGTLISNYKISSVNYTVEDYTENTKHTITEYPASAAVTDIGNISNVYSIYRKTSEELQDYINSINMNNKIKITVSASTGANLTNIEEPDSKTDPINTKKDDAINVPNTGQEEINNKGITENTFLILLIIPMFIVFIKTQKLPLRHNINFDKKV